MTRAGGAHELLAGAPVDREVTLQGLSIEIWEGEMLVIDTVQFADHRLHRTVMDEARPVQERQRAAAKPDRDALRA